MWENEAENVAASGAQAGKAFEGGKVFERVFSEGMALVEQAAAYLDGDGRADSNRLEGDPALTYASWSMELTTRLMQAASWLVMQKAVRDGDMLRRDAFQDKYRIRRDEPGLDASAQRGLGMPERFLDLVERSEALFERICRLDEALYGDEVIKARNPVNAQLSALEDAAASGVFDPLSIWRR
ncbi:MAG: DUF1465 family protein [Pseudomonadota bacterium]